MSPKNFRISFKKMADHTNCYEFIQTFSMFIVFVKWFVHVLKGYSTPRIFRFFVILLSFWWTDGVLESRVKSTVQQQKRVKWEKKSGETRPWWQERKQCFLDSLRIFLVLSCISYAFTLFFISPAMQLLLPPVSVQLPFTYKFSSCPFSNRSCFSYILSSLLS